MTLANTEVYCARLRPSLQANLCKSNTKFEINLDAANGDNSLLSITYYTGLQIMKNDNSGIFIFF